MYVLFYAHKKMPALRCVWLVLVVFLFLFAAEPTSPAARVLLPRPLFLPKPKKSTLLRPRLLQDELEVLQLALLVLTHGNLEIVRSLERNVVLVLVPQAGSKRAIKSGQNAPLRVVRARQEKRSPSRSPLFF